jgi:hypothetical protein
MRTRCPSFHARASRGVLVIGCVLGLAGTVRLWSDDRVAVRAKADLQYEAARFNGGPPRDQTYLFYEGRFFGGTTRDRTLERTAFLDIAQTLAVGLAKQRYMPTNDLRKADLLIVVHWGVTTPTVSMREMLGQTSLMRQDGEAQTRQMIKQAAEAEREGSGGDSGFTFLQQEAKAIDDFIEPAALANAEMFRQFDALSQETSMASNARLLGFSEDLRKDQRTLFGTPVGTMLRSMLTDERYFVVLLAYDYQALVREQKRKLLWSARLSMQSPGMNFREGIVSMSTVGGTVFGHQTDSVEVKRSSERSTKVEIGPVRVLSMPATP